MGINGDMHDGIRVRTRSGSDGIIDSVSNSLNRSLPLAVLILLFSFRRFASAGDRCCFSDVSVLARVALANAGRLSTEIAQVIKLRAPHVAFLYYIDVIDDRRVKRKNSLDTDAEAGLAHGDRFAHAAVLARNADALESLKALFGLGFFDPNMNADCVARLKIRNVIS